MRTNEPTTSDGLSLDVGSGKLPKGTVNTDIRPLPGLDVVCDALSLPFRKGVFAQLFLSHTVEHFRYDDVERLLEEARRVLSRDGKIEIWTPNFQALSVLRAWLFGKVELKNPPLLYAPLSGDQDYPENTHLSQWSIALIERYLTAQGFRIVFAKSEGDYSGALLPIKLFVRILKNRGGVIHVLAIKETKPVDKE
jgi:predicted SAM-dependent methyltransferase